MMSSSFWVIKQKLVPAKRSTQFPSTQFPSSGQGFPRALAAGAPGAHRSDAVATFARRPPTAQLWFGPLKMSS